MKPLSTIDVAKQYLSTAFNGYSTMKYIDRLLQALITPDIEGTPLNSIADYNITHDGDGNIVIEITVIENQVTLKGEEINAAIRWNETNGTIEFSTDDGDTWVVLAETGDIPNYDVDEDGIVDEANIASRARLGPTTDVPLTQFVQAAQYDAAGKVAKAEELDDGSNVATAAEVRNHLNNTLIHVGGFLSESGYVANQFLALSALAQERQIFLDGWADSFITADAIDPSSQDYIVSQGKIFTHGEISVFESGLTLSSGGTSYYSERTKIPASLLLADGQNIKLKFSINAAAQLRVYVGHKGAGAFDFDGNQVQIFKDGAGTIEFGDGLFLSDLITFALDSSKDLIIAADCINGWRSWGSLTDVFSWYFPNDTADQTSPTGGGSRGENLSIISDIYTYGGLGTFVVMFAPFTLASPPTSGRVLLHVNPVEAITPGTDVTVYQAAESVAPSWEAFSSFSVYDLADGTQLIDTQQDFMTSGTSPQLKIETPTGKEIEIMAVEHLFA